MSKFASCVVSRCGMRLLLGISLLVAPISTQDFFISTSHPLPYYPNTHESLSVEVGCASEANFRLGLLIDVSVVHKDCLRLLSKLFNRTESSVFNRTLTFAAPEVRRCSKAKLESVRVDYGASRMRWIFRCLSKENIMFLADAWSADWISWMAIFLAVFGIYLPLVTLFVNLFTDKGKDDLIFERIKKFQKELAKKMLEYAEKERKAALEATKASWPVSPAIVREHVTSSSRRRKSSRRVTSSQQPYSPTTRTTIIYPRPPSLRLDTTQSSRTSARTSPVPKQGVS